MRRLFTGRKTMIFILPAAILVVLIAMAESMPERVLADGGGGLPTRTRTATLIPLAPTNTPTGTLFLGLPSTPTDTPGVGGGFLKYPLPSEQAAISQGGAANAPESSGVNTLLSCWPVALIALVILIIVVLVVSSRLRQSAKP